MWSYHKYIIEVDCCISPTYLICLLGWLLHLANTSQMPLLCLLDYLSPCVNLCLSNIVPDMAYALLKLLKVDNMLSWSSHMSYSFPPFHTSQHTNDSSECTDKPRWSYNYNNACANLKSVAKDNIISASYIDDGEEAKLYLWKKWIIQTLMHFLSVNYCWIGTAELPSHLNPI
jgi:hypothetical protein